MVEVVKEAVVVGKIVVVGKSVVNDSVVISATICSVAAVQQQAPINRSSSSMGKDNRRVIVEDIDELLQNKQTAKNQYASHVVHNPGTVGMGD